MMTKPTYKKGIEVFENILDSMNIENFEIIPNENWLLYKINFTTTSKKVLFTDEYKLTVEMLYEFLPLLTNGDCIYLMGFWQSATTSAQEIAEQNGIYIANYTNIKKLIYK